MLRTIQKRNKWGLPVNRVEKDRSIVAGIEIRSKVDIRSFGPILDLRIFFALVYPARPARPARVIFHLKVEN